MIVILIAILFLFFLRANAKQKMLSIGIGAVLFLVSVGKDIFSNSDLIGYYHGYLAMDNNTFGGLWQAYIAGDKKDFGYHACAKIFSLLGLDAEVWFGFIALVFAVCVAISLYRHSADPFVSVIILFAFFFRFTLSGLRQTIALGLVLISYQYIKERKFLPYILLLGVAFFFHSSVIIFIPAYWIYNFRVGVKQLAVVLGALGVCVLAPGVIRMIITNVAWTDYLQRYATREEVLTWSGYLIQLCLLIFCYVLRGSISEEKRKRCIDPYINFMIVGLCLCGASSVIAEMFRLSYYYAMASMFAIPNIITNLEKKNAKLAYIAVCCTLIGYVIYSDSYTVFNLYNGILG